MKQGGSAATKVQEMLRKQQDTHASAASGKVDVKRDSIGSDVRKRSVGLNGSFDASNKDMPFAPAQAVQQPRKESVPRASSATQQRK